MQQLNKGLKKQYLLFIRIKYVLNIHIGCNLITDSSVQLWLCCLYNLLRSRKYEKKRKGERDFG